MNTRSTAYGRLKLKFPACLLKFLFFFLDRSLKLTAKDVDIFCLVPSKNLKEIFLHFKILHNLKMEALSAIIVPPVNTN